MGVEVGVEVRVEVAAAADLVLRTVSPSSHFHVPRRHLGFGQPLATFQG